MQAQQFQQQQLFTKEEMDRMIAEMQEQAQNLLDPNTFSQSYSTATYTKSTDYDEKIVTEREYDEHGNVIKETRTVYRPERKPKQPYPVPYWPQRTSPPPPYTHNPSEWSLRTITSTC